MKGTERALYNTLISLPSGGGYGLCNICQFAEWSGYDCESSILDCRCGLEKIEENAYDVWEGGDCWAFRPRWSLDDIADSVGIMLQGKVPDMSNCKERIPKKLKEV